MHTQPSPRSALVTGGSSGIGLAIARHLQQQGYRVALVARDRRRLEAVSAELGGVAWMAADLARRDDVEAVAAWIGETFDTLDVLVNNAGFTRLVAATTPLAEAEREWDALLAGNLKSAFLMSLALLPHFAEEGGRIIHIGSIAAQAGSGSPGALGYAAAKAGLHGFGLALARELGPRNHGEQRGAGLHRRYPVLPRRSRPAAGGRHRRGNPAGPDRASRGHRRGGGLAGLARGWLRHRNGGLGERWLAGRQLKRKRRVTPMASDCPRTQLNSPHSCEALAILK